LKVVKYDISATIFDRFQWNFMHISLSNPIGYQKFEN